MKIREVLNPIALRKAKIACNFGLSECNRVEQFFSLESNAISVGWLVVLGLTAL